MMVVPRCLDKVLLFILLSTALNALLLSLFFNLTMKVDTTFTDGVRVDGVGHDDLILR